MFNLIEPKYKKSEIENLSPFELRDIVQQIFNFSLLSQQNSDFTVNSRLKDYENIVFINDEYTQILLDNKIDYLSSLNLIDDKNSVVNLKWLKSLSDKDYDVSLRNKKLLKFPVEKVLLVEGITEEILLPAFSKFLGRDFYAEGIQIIPAGGKNQVVKLYYKLSQELKLPIYVLLDRDAEENIAQIQPRLRNIDKLHLVSCGEFEDLLPKLLIIKTLNNDLNNFSHISLNDFDDNLSTVENLVNIFKQKGLHEFKKAEFAKSVRDNISEESDISEEIQNIINEI